MEKLYRASQVSMFLILVEVKKLYKIFNITLSKSIEKLSNSWHVKTHNSVNAKLTHSQLDKFKNKRKTTHMWRRWGTPHNFCSTFIHKIEKQPLKNWWSGPNVGVLTITILYFLKYIKNLEISLFYTCYQMVWSTVPEI